MLPRAIDYAGCQRGEHHEKGLFFATTEDADLGTTIVVIEKLGADSLLADLSQALSSTIKTKSNGR